jgi:hypothetical protein
MAPVLGRRLRPQAGSATALLPRPIVIAGGGGGGGIFAPVGVPGQGGLTGPDGGAGSFGQGAGTGGNGGGGAGGGGGRIGASIESGLDPRGPISTPHEATTTMGQPTLL